jgi:hypothetical protein
MWFNFSFNVRFALRNLLSSHSFFVIFPFFCLIILSCSYGIFVCEREVPGRFFTFDNAVWITLITASAVGYGTTNTINTINTINTTNTIHMRNTMNTI